MNVFTSFLTMCLLAISVQANTIGAEWMPSKDWIRIDSALFIALSGWDRSCNKRCYTTVTTRHKEEVGYYINRRSKKIISIELNTDPRALFLRR